MIDSTSTELLLKITAGITFAVTGVVFGIQKALRFWNSDRKYIAKDNVETGLFQMMQQETARLHKQNNELANTIAELREEMGNLHKEIIILRNENSLLNLEVKSLHDELALIRQERLNPSSRFSDSLFEDKMA